MGSGSGDANLVRGCDLRTDMVDRSLIANGQESTNPVHWADRSLFPIADIVVGRGLALHPTDLGVRRKQMSRWLIVLAFCGGTIAVLPTLIMADGLRSQFYGSRADPAKRIFETARDDQFTSNFVLGGYPQWLHDIAAKCGYVPATSNSETALTFESAWDALYRRQSDFLRVQAISELTTAFSRTTLSYCFSIPLLSHVCRGYAIDLVERAENRSKSKRDASAKRLTKQLSPLRCASFSLHRRLK